MSQCRVVAMSEAAMWAILGGAAGGALTMIVYWWRTTRAARRLYGATEPVTRHVPTTDQLTGSVRCGCDHPRGAHKYLAERCLTHVTGGPCGCKEYQP
jgi:hypothetical protein